MAIEKGHVRWFSETKGFGFIEREQGADIFVHRSAIVTTGRNVLHENDRVEFTAVQGDKGWRADNVTVIDS